MKKLKNNKGNALTATVITSAILIFVIGNICMASINENGVITRSQQAALTYNISAAKEQVELAICNYQIQYYDELTQNFTVQKNGEWIYKKYGQKDLKTSNFTFSIDLPEGKSQADEENPYIITIAQKNQNDQKITGRLSINGDVEWDSEEEG